MIVVRRFLFALGALACLSAPASATHTASAKPASVSSLSREQIIGLYDKARSTKRVRVDGYVVKIGKLGFFSIRVPGEDRQRFSIRPRDQRLKRWD